MVCLAAFILLSFFSSFSHAAIIRVKTDGNDANSGADWAHPKKSVTAAIAAANQGDEIWVAAGTYQEHIHNKSAAGVAVDVALYGGFKGDETALDQRNPSLNVTILDGGGGAFPAPPFQGAVIVIDSGAGPATRIDGFTITGGHGIHGGGIKTVASGPVIANNIITKNLTDGAGAGISVWSYKLLPEAQPLIINNTIVENSSVNSEGDGGGVAVVGASAIIIYNTISQNEVTRNGGGIAVWRNSLPLIANNFIASNSAGIPQVNDTDAGSLGMGGGIFASATELDGSPVEGWLTAPIILNNLIAANGAYTGGGVCLVDSILPFEVPKLINNTILSNNGSGVYFYNIPPVIKNNIVAYNTWGVVQLQNEFTNPVIAFNDVYGNILQGKDSDFQGLADPTGTNGNLSVDPGIASRLYGRYHIQPGSPLIGAGSDAAVNDAYSAAASRYPGIAIDQVDIDGNARLIGAAVDIGADESDGALWNSAPIVAYAKAGGSNANDGLSWSKAKGTVQAAISVAAQEGGEVWVGGGTYTGRITLPAHVFLYGGFAGSEITRAERNVDAHPTTLDGGGLPLVISSRNAGYLVSGLDGFTVQNSGHYSNGTIPIQNPNQFAALGGGMRCRVSSPVVSNNVFQWNSVGTPFAALFARGGAIALYQSFAVVRDNLFTENEVLAMDGMGGGIYCVHSQPDIDGNSFYQNHARKGSAIYGVNSAPRITNNLVQSNTMYDWYGLINGSTEGAISLSLSPDFLIERNTIRQNSATGMGAGICVQSNFGGTIRNNLVSENYAVDPYGTGGMGGGIYADVPANANDNLLIVNNTIVSNSAGVMLGIGQLGGGIALALLPPLPTPPSPPPPKIVIANNIVAFNNSGFFETLTFPQLQPTLVRNVVFNTGSNYEIVLPGATDLNADPKFVNKAGKDFRLLSDSPCIDAGDSSLLPLPAGFDFDGAPRILDGNGDGLPVVDMGAYEFHNPLIRPPVDLNKDGLGDAFLYNSTTGAWSEYSGGGTAFADMANGWWSPDWQIKPTDFNGDGITDLFLYHATYGYWYKAIGDGEGGFAYHSGQWSGGWEVHVADLNGDRRDDVFLYHPSIGLWYRCVSPADPATGFVYSYGYWSPGWTVYTVDWNGDAKTDLFLYNKTNGSWYQATNIDPDPAAWSYSPGSWMPEWDVHPGDFNGDGKSDMFLYQPGSGTWYVAMNAAGGFSYTLGWWAPGWTIHTGDFNGDGATDLFVYNSTNGGWYVCISNKAGYFSSYYPGNWANVWHVQVTDFNNDGKADVLLYYPFYGAYYLCVTQSTPGSFAYYPGSWPSDMTLVVRRE